MIFDKMIEVIKRENNLKRSFLFLNKYQAKYVPTRPKDALHLFGKLGSIAAEKYPEGQVTIIGFAETATAIGAVVAETFGQRGYYIQTTRENLSPKELMVYFEEEHSHAVDQYLYCQSPNQLKQSKVILFVDDELTTGKTICNFVDALQKKGEVDKETVFAVASLINCMNPEHFERFKEKGIECLYLEAKEKNWGSVSWEGNPISDTAYLVAEGCERKKLPHGCNPRRGTSIAEYHQACMKLAENLENILPPLQEREKEILVLGSEECMYPALIFAERLEEKYPAVKAVVQATSRSPIQVLDNENYYLKNRSRIRSLYNKERTVFLYNLKQYDRVILITDSKNPSEEALSDTISALKYYGNENITVIEWEEP